MTNKRKRYEWEKTYHPTWQRYEAYRQAVGGVVDAIAKEYTREADMACFASNQVAWLDEADEKVGGQLVYLYGYNIPFEEAMAEFKSIALEAEHHCIALRQVLERMSEELGFTWAPRKGNAFEGEKIYIDEFVTEGLPE